MEIVQVIQLEMGDRCLTLKCPAQACKFYINAGVDMLGNPVRNTMGSLFQKAKSNYLLIDRLVPSNKYLQNMFLGEVRTTRGLKVQKLT